MPISIRVIVGLALVGVAVFCVLGLLATGDLPDEPTPRLVRQVAYAAVGLTCLTVLVWLVRRRSKSEPTSVLGDALGNPREGRD